jgi:hypothetical protein
MQDQFLDDLETELDMSVDSAASWLESFVERADIDENDYETIQTIISNLYDCSDFIRQELGIGGEEEPEEEDDYDSHLPPLFDDEEDEEDTATFVGTWESIRFLEDDDGNVVGLQVDFA